MNNEKAFYYFNSNKNNSISSISKEFVAEFALNASQCDEIHLIFSKLNLERRDFARNKSLEIWNESLFCQLPNIPEAIVYPREQEVSVTSSIQSTLTFEEDVNRVPYKHIDKLSTKGLGIQLDSLISLLRTDAEKEHVAPKTIASYLLMLNSQKNAISQVNCM